MLHTDDHIDRMSKADSVIALLGRLDLERLPTHEARAVREFQAKAVDDWLSAYADSRKITGAKVRSDRRVRT